MSEILSLLRATVQRFLESRGVSADRRSMTEAGTAWSPAVWGEMATLGLLAAPLSAARGGIGSPDALLVVMQEFGRKLAPEPYISAVAIGGSLFCALDDEESLAKMTGGALRVAFADGQGEAASKDATSRASSTEIGFRLSAYKPMLLDSHAASHLCLTALVDGAATGIFLLPVDTPGLVINEYRTVDGRSAAEVRCSELELPASVLLARGETADRIIIKMRQEATIAICAEAVGIMRSMLDMTAAYTRERKQFGVTLSSFQVLRHRMADMLLEIEQAESATLMASRSGGDGYTIAQAKIRVNRALRNVAHEAIQLHGGIGTTEELELSQYFRRAVAIQKTYGATDHLVDELVTRAPDRIVATYTLAERCVAATDDTVDSEQAFRIEIRDFLDKEFSAEMRAEANRQTGVFAEPELAARWHEKLYRKGWVAPSWPVEFGGPGWNARKRLIFDEECAFVNTPLLPAMGLQMCGPVLMKFGTEHQKTCFLPRILSGEHRWCQGYSEPNAGSDLASLKCRMEREGADYVINGTKIWTTFAHTSNWIFMLTRTDPAAKPQEGISFVLVPMDSPGITIRPIRSMSGEHEVNQVFFDNVRIPKTNLVGEENQGWQIAKYLLEFERGGGSSSARTIRVLGLLQNHASRTDGLGREHLRRLLDLRIELASTGWSQMRFQGNRETGQSPGDVGASLIKIKSSEVYQQACELFVDVVGDWALADQREALFNGGTTVGPEFAITAVSRYLNSRAMTIFGGSSEVQRTILARVGLHL